MSEIRQWEGALRSGDFTQATGKLQDSEGNMCCLGVACELFRRATGQGKWERNVDQFYFSLNGHRAWSMPPLEVLSWLGITKKQSETFAEMNDTFGANFHQIAQATLLLRTTEEV